MIATSGFLSFRVHQIRFRPELYTADPAYVSHRGPPGWFKGDRRELLLLRGRGRGDASPLTQIPGSDPGIRSICFYLRGNEADCLINEPGEEIPLAETTTLDDISKFCMKSGHLILGKIIKFVVTRCQILWLKCTKFVFGWGPAPDPALGKLTALPQTL